MNWTTFFALLARDAHVARRNAIQLLLQTFLQPLLFVSSLNNLIVCEVIDKCFYVQSAQIRQA